VNLFWDAKKFCHVQNQKRNLSDKMEKTIISSKFPRDDQHGQKPACSIKKNSSVLQCKIDEPVVSEYLCMPIEHEKLAAESCEKSLVEQPGDANESKDEDAPDVVRALSLMSLEATHDDTIATSTVQCYNIFQSESKIQDKVCKLIIDGRSFTNAISSDLVHALSLSTWRIPAPCYMQWMNQSGTLKITQKVRVKFSVDSYVYTVSCDVAPLSACHLLLARPWRFDLNATHGSRSNNYSFAQKGVHHVLKPMLESAIKMDIFPAVRKRKKDPPMDTPKRRTTLFQEGENDETVTYAANKSKLADILSKPRMALIKGREDDELMTPQNISGSIKVNKCKHLIIVAGNNLRTSPSLWLGAFSFDVTPCNKVFIGSKLLCNGEKNQHKKLESKSNSNSSASPTRNPGALHIKTNA
jgi:hypothetical protein